MVYLLSLAVAGMILLAFLWMRERESWRRERIQAEDIRQKEADYLRRTLRRAELLHRLADGLEDGLFILGSDMRVLFANLGTKHFFQPVSEPVGRRLVECVPHASVVELAEMALATGRRQTGEITVASAEQGQMRDRVFEILALPLQGDAASAAEGDLLLILRDETEKHALEKIRKDFVANASHELRTPLSIIIGYLENLLDGDIGEPQEIQRAFTVMKKHGDRLGQIVEDLLVISRMESGQDEALRLEKFDLRDSVADVIHRLTPVIAAKGADVRLVTDKTADTNMNGDRFYWDQILFNLVQNALKENLAKGLRVEVSLKSTGDGFITIEVKDNGVGIPQADLPFVFKRFYRVARPEFMSEIKGTGLGLSIVKRAVEAHGGTIALQSTPGVETVFTIRVPAGRTKS